MTPSADSGSICSNSSPSPIRRHSAGSWSRKPTAHRSSAAFFTQKVRAHVHRELARYLRRATRRGELRCSEPELAAKLFSGRLSPTTRFLGSSRQALSLSRGRKCADVEEAVELFLARYGPSP
ncbi:MAG: TetR/AcrR family transcriptional regulator C-terminal domain-containing protein [Methylocella sp.]